MKVKVLFFGVLSEVTRTEIKIYEEVKSTEHLKLRVADDFPEIVHYQFKLSVNNELVNEDMSLNNNDEVGFLPPFAGG